MAAKLRKPRRYSRLMRKAKRMWVPAELEHDTETDDPMSEEEFWVGSGKQSDVGK